MIDNNLHPHTAMPLSLLETVFGLAMWLNCNPSNVMFSSQAHRVRRFGQDGRGALEFHFRFRQSY